MNTTYSESSLHKSLKKLYKIERTTDEENYEMEKKVCDFRCDLVYKNHIIEIQTARLSKLKEKIEALIDNYQMTIVFPLVVAKKLITVDENNERISSRKSPKQHLIYSLFNELTQIYPFLLHPHFTLEVLLITTEEIRIKASENSSLCKKKRRRRKQWIKINKLLDSVEKKITFSAKEDYIELLYELALPQIFSSKDIQKTVAKNYAHIMLWVFKRMNLIQLEKKERNLCFYSVV
ncbi:MAG: hypothetical protein ACRC5H_10680 [Treponemataceae bacterium]